ncbi:MAG: ornithine cyclodeaminase family protein, partial [Marivita sp.]|uniref:ornithine cyclodeaminase family protein n=1 Tax=Marivita sp. TaxID=2003365 RepID=UPI003EF4FE8E
IWNRTRESAASLAGDFERTEVADDLEAAVRSADIVTTATMVREPLISGDWLRPGTHLDLIGAYRPDMREADDTALLRSRIFVDARATTMGHIGELKIPLEAGVIDADAIVADYTQIDRFRRRSDDEITLFKNGGGAHMDLMVSRHILEKWNASR